MIKWFILLLALNTGAALYAQNNEVYDNRNFGDNIYTVTLHKLGEPNNPLPVITLGTPSQLTLSFDELGTESHYYQYTLVHCDANWHPSDLQQQQYLDGSPVANIEEYRNSKSLRQNYVHYQVNLPDPNTHILFCG